MGPLVTGNAVKPFTRKNNRKLLISATISIIKVIKWQVNKQHKPWFGSISVKSSWKKSWKNLIIVYSGVRIKHQNSWEFPGCTLEGNLVLVNMATKGLGKISYKLKLSRRQGNSSNNCLRTVFCIFLVEPHFDCASFTSYPFINETFKGALQKTQNKCIRFWT